jgi:hypothetical protein
LNGAESVFSNEATAIIPSGVFGAGAFMQSGRLLHTATALPNGKILIAGGTSIINSTLTALNTAELYDPSTGTFTFTANNMLAPRTAHTATLLATGQVLIAGHNFRPERYWRSHGRTPSSMTPSATVLSALRLYPWYARETSTLLHF